MSRMRKKHRPDRWPDGCKCAVILSFDFDAESDSLRSAPGKIVQISKGMYAGVGVGRILDLLEEFSIPGTFFVPGWVAENYMEKVKEIQNRGFEISGHGYMHERVSEMSVEEEKIVLTKCIEGIRQAIGSSPMGYRAPWDDYGRHSLRLLSEFGFEYDSSLMNQDLPYFIKVEKTDKLSLLELPIDWCLDDYPAFEVDRKSPRQVRDIWQAEFNGLYSESSLFNLTMHPECIGRPARIKMLRELIRYMKSKSKVWFASANEVAKWWRKTNPDDPGIEIPSGQFRVQ